MHSQSVPVHRHKRRQDASKTATLYAGECAISRFAWNRHVQASDQPWLRVGEVRENSNGASVKIFCWGGDS